MRSYTVGPGPIASKRSWDIIRILSCHGAELQRSGVEVNVIVGVVEGAGEGVNEGIILGVSCGVLVDVIEIEIGVRVVAPQAVN